MYSGMTKSALEWQIKIRKFVDNELIPWEVHAEMNNGEIIVTDDVGGRVLSSACLAWEYQKKKVVWSFQCLSK